MKNTAQKYVSATLKKEYKGFVNILLLEQILWKWKVKILGNNEVIIVYEDEFTVANFVLNGNH